MYYCVTKPKHPSWLLGFMFSLHVRAQPFRRVCPGAPTNSPTGVADDDGVAAADYGDVYYYNGEGLRCRGETEKRSGASIPVGHPLHEMTAQQRGEGDCTQALSGPGLATADDCEDGENPG